jgi:hypothetical protein
MRSGRSLSWTRVIALLPAVLACCAKVSTPEEMADAGPTQPTVAEVEPPPGTVQANARFAVHFSDPMDEGQLLAASGRSETVALVPETEVERAAAAIEHAPLSAHERTLLIAATAQIASDRKSIALAPDQPLAPGGYYLLVSPRLKDERGRRLAGNGARFGYQVSAPPRGAKLIAPTAGGEAPWNLAVVRAFAEAGRVALIGPSGQEIAAADAHGPVELRVTGSLIAGGRYALSLDGSAAADQSFIAAACARSAAPALQGGTAQLSVRDTGVTAQLVLDWPAHIELAIEDAVGAAVIAAADVLCAPPPCGPQSFVCPASVRVEGLKPATEYMLQLTARDDFNFTLRTPPRKFSTVAALPRVVIAEVMASGVDGEYAELLNFGPGAANLEMLGFQGPDGIVRPLLATPPPLPLLLAPGSRALAVGASFDQALYPALPIATPVLRASTQRLLGRGLSDDATPPFRLVSRGQVPVELAEFPATAPHCAAGISVQRDEAIPSDGAPGWSCGLRGGTPGRPP